MATTDPKPPITCHVLDTTAGHPAPNIPVTLTLLPPSPTTTPIRFTAHTNADGRVTTWTAQSTATLASVYAGPGDQRYSLSFDTGPYFAARGVDAFFPEVELKFVVRAGQRARGERFHVPVLVGGFAYTAYRGS